MKTVTKLLLEINWDSFSFIEKVFMFKVKIYSFHYLTSYNKHIWRKYQQKITVDHMLVGVGLPLMVQGSVP